MSFRFSLDRRTVVFLTIAALAACSTTSDQVVGPLRSPSVRHDAAQLPAQVVISQIYGGGGNSQAPLHNDFIELFNQGTTPVDVSTWSVQYSSNGQHSFGGSNLITNLTGTIQPGHYYLIQEAPGSGGGSALPTPDVTGGTGTTIAMSASNGKVVLVKSQTPIGNACPSGQNVVDFVEYGTQSLDCDPNGVEHTSPNLANGTAAFRKNAGCLNTGHVSTDFENAAPAPRNSSTPAVTCANGDVKAGPLDHVIVNGVTPIPVTGSATFTATAKDASNIDIKTATVTWKSSDPSIASVDPNTGVVTGVAVSQTPVTITATANDNGNMKDGTFDVTVVQATIGFIDVSSSSSAFPPGFQTQIFATARVSNGGIVIPATFTFSEDPGFPTGIVSLMPVGSSSAIVTGLAVGTSHIQITATPIAPGGTGRTFTSAGIQIVSPVVAPLSTYAPAINDEFGDPTPASNANPNDFLIQRTQYTLSYNQSHGTPNWVSYELDARQIVQGNDRCNCFTADPLLPASAQIFTSDYTNGGFDRGHMTRSFDRTAANVDNANTFMLTNVVPQTADLNEGVWAQFEDALGDSATLGGRAVYIITGPIYSTPLHFLKNEGKVAIPDSTWKIAIIGPDPSNTPFTHNNIHTLADMTGITVLAVNMPNIAGIHNDPWQKYLTTVGKIEKSTGFNFLSVLDESIQCKVEVRDCLPVSHIVSASGLSTTKSGSSFTINIGATDADGADGPWKLNVDWGDNSAPFATTLFALPTDAHPLPRGHVFSGAPGTSFTIHVTITDKKGGSATSTFVVTIAP